MDKGRAIGLESTRVVGVSDFGIKLSVINYLGLPVRSKPMAWPEKSHWRR